MQQVAVAFSPKSTSWYVTAYAPLLVLYAARHGAGIGFYVFSIIVATSNESLKGLPPEWWEWIKAAVYVYLTVVQVYWAMKVAGSYRRRRAAPPDEEFVSQRAENPLEV